MRTFACDDIIGLNNGTLVGATFAPGKVGRAFSFVGVDHDVEITDSALDDRTDARLI